MSDRYGTESEYLTSQCSETDDWEQQDYYPESSKDRRNKKLRDDFARWIAAQKKREQT